MKRRPEKTVLLLLLLVLLGSGCAYFNTYYNAQRYYEEGIRSIERGQGGRAQTGKLNESLKVASRVLEFYPESRWVDDALLLMGKSYFYLQNYYNAIGKFSELREKFPESELIPQCNLWQAKSLLELREFDEARTWLVLIVKSKAPRDVWVESRMVLGVILEELGNLEQAANAYREVVDSARDKRLKGRAWYQLGLVSLRMNNLEEAAASFARVGRFHPGVEIERQASLGHIDAEIWMHNYRRAEKLIARGLKDEHYFEEWDRFELKECLLLEERGDFSEAIDCYRSHLDEYSRLSSTATACFRLGSIYLLHYDQPDSALKYYEQVSAEERESVWRDSTDVMMTKLERLLYLLDDLAIADSLLTMNQQLMDPAWLRVEAMWERTYTYRAEEVRVADSLAAAAVRSDSLAIADSLVTAAGGSDSLAVADSLQIMNFDSLAVAGSMLTMDGDSTAILHEELPPQSQLPLSEQSEDVREVTDISIPDVDPIPVIDEPAAPLENGTPPPSQQDDRSGRRSPLFKEPLSPVFPNEDADSLMVHSDSTSADGVNDSLLAVEQARQDTLLFNSFMDSVVFTAQIDSVNLLSTRDSLRLAWGTKIMTLGELYLLEMNRRVDADSLMTTIDTSWLSDRQLVHRRWFIGWMRELDGDSLAAREHYDLLLEQYPLSEEAKYLRNRLGLPPQRSAEDFAAEMCLLAEQMWIDSLHYQDALALYREVVILYPETTVAPRALLAEAWLYSRFLENQTKADEAFDLLQAEYPASPEALLAAEWRSSTPGESGVEEDTDSVADKILENLLAPQQDESGMFIRVDEAAYLEEKINNFQEHMLNIGVIEVHRILK